MGWFKDDVSERLNKLEAEVAWLRRDDLLKGIRRKNECERCEDKLPKEGLYKGEVISMETPRLRPVSTTADGNDWRINLRVKLDDEDIPVAAHVGFVLPKSAAMAMHALRHEMLGKRVTLRNKHRAIPNGTSACTSDGVQVIAAWTIEEWDDNNVKTTGC